MFRVPCIKHLTISVVCDGANFIMKGWRVVYMMGTKHFEATFSLSHKVGLGTIWFYLKPFILCINSHSPLLPLPLPLRVNGKRILMKKKKQQEKREQKGKEIGFQHVVLFTHIFNMSTPHSAYYEGVKPRNILLHLCYTFSFRGTVAPNFYRSYLIANDYIYIITLFLVVKAHLAGFAMMKNRDSSIFRLLFKSRVVFVLQM